MSIVKQYLLSILEQHFNNFNCYYSSLAFAIQDCGASFLSLPFQDDLPPSPWSLLSWPSAASPLFYVVKSCLARPVCTSVSALTIPFGISPLLFKVIFLFCKVYHLAIYLLSIRGFFPSQSVSVNNFISPFFHHGTVKHMIL